MVGTITLSVEIELGWGMHDQGEFSHLSHDRTTEEQALSRLLAVCDDQQIEISFDIVGHLYHNACSGSHEGPYPTDWWKNDPGSSAAQAPLFYAPSMVTAIAERSVDHELCTHTYSHILAAEMCDEVTRHELRRVRTIHDEWDIPESSSIVMPRHQEVNYSVLSEYGIEVIRRPIETYGGSDLTPPAKLWWLFTRDHPICALRRASDGIVETTCTPHPSLASVTLPAGQRTPPLYFRTMPRRIREYMHRRYLCDAFELAADTHSHVHLWTHLFNIANDSQWRALKPALERLGELRNQGCVDVHPMRDLPSMV